MGEDGRVKMQFRIDAFNVFNHTIFTGVNSSLAYTAYPANSSGVITGLADKLYVDCSGDQQPRTRLQRSFVPADRRFRQPHAVGSRRVRLLANPSDGGPR